MGFRNGAPWSWGSGARTARDGPKMGRCETTPNPPPEPRHISMSAAGSNRKKGLWQSTVAMLPKGHEALSSAF